MRKTLQRSLAALVAGLFILVAGLQGGAALAQSAGAASVQGGVTDPTGASVPGATVTLTNTETKAARTSTTDSDGRYSLPNVAPGPYQLTVTGQGFQTYLQKGIVLEVGAAVTINAGLTLGSETQEVTVESNAVVLESESSTFKQVIDQKQINELPLNGRQATQLVLVSGGAVVAPTGDMVGSKNYASSVVIAVAGSQGNYNNYVLDGGYHVDEFTNVNLPFPFPDALREFSVESNSLPARNGLHPGALVNAVTVSGTNQWHGSAFDYIRNNIINATNFFSTAVDTLKRNQFGGTLGGPIKKDRLFFFGGYQGTRNRQVSNATGYCIPTPAELAGDFSQMGGLCPKTVADNANLVNPADGSTISTAPGSANYRKVNTGTYSTPSLNLVKYLPTSLADQYGRVNVALPSNYTEDQFVGRVDYTFNSKHTLYGRYYLTNYNYPAYYSATNLLLTTTAGNDERVQSFTLGDTYIFTPKLVNTFHGTYSRRRDNRGPTAGGINSTSLGVNMFNYVPADLRLTVSNNFSVGCGTCSPGFFNVNTEDFADDIDFLQGKHAFAFGGEYIRTGDNTQAGYLQNGQYTFNGQLSGVNNKATGEPMIDFLTGRMQSFGQSRAQQTTFRQNIIGFYAQDTFHATPKVTLSYGIRYEPMLYQTDKFGRGSLFSQANFNAGIHSTVFPNAPAGSLFYGDAGVPKKFTNNRWNNFSPRLGVALTPNSKTVIRAGTAMMYDTPGLYTSQRLTSNPPYTDEIDLTGNISFANPWATYPGGNPFPGVFPPNQSAIFPTNTLYIVLPQTIRTPVVYQWTGSVQRDLGVGWSSSINYLGNRNAHQWIGTYPNAAVYIPGNSTGVAGSCGGLTGANLPAAGTACSTTSSGNTNARTPLSLANPAQGTYYSPTLTLIDDHASTNYNGAIFTIQRRGRGSFSFLANYTYSKCLSLADNPGDVASTTYQNTANAAADYSYCGFDVRHIFNSTVVAQSQFKSLHGVSGFLANGWQIAPLIRLTSGLPINITSGVDNSRTGQGNDRPNFVPGVSQYTGKKITLNASGNRFYLNSAAYSSNAVGTFGNLARNSARGPNNYDVDASLSRIFPLYERLNLQLRLEGFNLFNHPYFSTFTTALNSSQFGYATATPADEQRIFQAAAKFNF